MLGLHKFAGSCAGTESTVARTKNSGQVSSTARRYRSSLLPTELTWRLAGGPGTTPLLEAGLPQTTEDVIDRGLVRVQSLQSGLSEGQVRVETLQVGEGGLRFPDPAELGKSGDDIGEAGRPVP